MTTTTLVSTSQHITIMNLDGADRSGTVITAGKENFCGQFVTIRLDVPYLAPNALNISKTVSLRIVPKGDNFVQPAFGKIAK